MNMIRVNVFDTDKSPWNYDAPMREYSFDWDDEKQREVFADQQINAYLAGQTIVSFPHPDWTK